MRKGRVERELGRHRPVARSEFVATLAAQTRARLHGPRRVMRVGLAFAVTVLVAAALAGVGAATYGASASTHAVKAVHGLAKTHTARHVVHNSPAHDQYGQKCNSGRGNWSETDQGSRSHNSKTLIDPHNGGRGPGSTPTDDCDPGNSGPHNHGGD
jgi:hypothetical protein